MTLTIRAQTADMAELQVPKSPTPHQRLKQMWLVAGLVGFTSRGLTDDVQSLQ